MKKTVILWIIIALTLGVVFPAFAQSAEAEDSQQKESKLDKILKKARSGCAGKGGDCSRRRSNLPFGGPFAGGGASLAATGDGGVVVLIGPKLLKYDKDLNLVKEVDIPLPVKVTRTKTTKRYDAEGNLKEVKTEE
ncbi:MAG: hypothetical protein MJA29_03540 [Candidatus Omnitrophica bacterium]|nr:hypothetical protein [Candidatus Omnitrophota bacterium]